MKGTLFAAWMVLVMCGMAGIAHAKLSIIGHVEYQSSPQGNVQTYLLIWDDFDDDGESVVWLDYTNYKRSWDNQQIWLNLLNGVGTVSPIRKIVLNPGYSVDWGNNLWRLPKTRDGLFDMNCSGTTTGGYNIRTSELGHLFYSELQNNGKCASDGTNPVSFGLVNKGPFEHIAAFDYWSGTVYAAEAGAARAWYFSFADGLQGVATKTSDSATANYPYALALRNAKVRYRMPVDATEPMENLRRGTTIDGIRKM